MYSSFKPKFDSVSYFAPTPLLPGDYILVDVSEAIETFYQLPSKTRMHLVPEGADLSEYDMIDVELTEIIPCISDVHSTEHELSNHVEHLLDEGVNFIIDELEGYGIEPEGRMIPNSTEQLDHAKASHELGHHLQRIFVEQGLYNEHGELIAEYDSLLDEGVIALRRR